MGHNMSEQQIYRESMSITKSMVDYYHSSQL